MVGKIVAIRLSSVLEKLKKDGVDGGLGNKIKFYAGNERVVVADILSKITPNARVAIIATEDTFKERGIAIVEALKSKNLKPVNVLFSSDFLLSVDGVCGTFNLFEDVRAVIVLDVVLYSTAYYFASIKNIPCVSVANKLNVKGVLSRKVYISNGTSVDTFDVDVERHIVFNEGIGNDRQDVADAFAYATSNVVGLTDYRFYGVVTRETLSKTAYDLARSSVLGSFALIKDREGMEEKLLLNCMIAEIADSLTEGKILTLSAPSIAEYLYSGRFGGNASVLLASACAIMDAYGKYLSDEKMELSFAPEYSNRAKRIFELVGIAEEQTLANYRVQSNKFVARKVKINEQKQKLKEEVIQSTRILNLAMDAYLSIAAKPELDLDKLADAVKLSGDVHFYINGMSLVRDNGIIKEK